MRHPYHINNPRIIVNSVQTSITYLDLSFMSTMSSCSSFSIPFYILPQQDISYSSTLIIFSRIHIDIYYYQCIDQTKYNTLHLIFDENTINQPIIVS